MSALERADLEVTSKGVEGSKVRRWPQQLELCGTRNGGDHEKKHYPARGSENPFSVNLDSLDFESYLLGGRYEALEDLEMGCPQDQGVDKE